MNSLYQLSRLVKAPLCLMVGTSAGFGFLLASSLNKTVSLLFVSLGVFLLSCGAAGLNSIQERDYDAAYQRTRKRPLVIGSVSLTLAYLLSFITAIGGLALLFLAGGSLLPPLLGALALLIYNGVYTPLKRVTEFAMIPGGISGALPPMIGWTAAGGGVSDPLILAIMVLFFLWQPPHFCLVLLRHREEGWGGRPFVTLSVRFPSIGIKRIIAVWLLSFTTVVLFLAFLPGLLPLTLKISLGLVAPLFLSAFLYNLFCSRIPPYRLLFVSLNSYLLWLMLVLSIGSTIQT